MAKTTSRPATIAVVSLVLRSPRVCVSGQELRVPRWRVRVPKPLVCVCVPVVRFSISSVRCRDRLHAVEFLLRGRQFVLSGAKLRLHAFSPFYTHVSS